MGTTKTHILKSITRSAKNTVKSAVGVVRRQPVMLMVGAVVVLIAATAVVFKARGGGFQDVVQSASSAVMVPAKLFEAPTIGELTDRVKANPNDAQAHLALADAQFAANKKDLAVIHYGRALELDPGLASESSVGRNLVSVLDRSDESKAAAILVKHRMDAPALHAMTGNSDPDKRMLAIVLLRKMERAHTRDYVRSWVADLGAQDCGVRQSAVSNLGKYGTRNELQAIRKANAKDVESTFLWTTCLGDRPEEAVKMILARK